MATSPVTAGEKSFPPLDPETFVPQLVWLVLTFGLLYVLLKRFALPRVGEVIEERQNRIQRDLEQAAALKAETEQALANYEQALIEARGRAHAVATDMSDKLAAEIHKERAQFDAQIARKLADADTGISQVKSKALADVSGIAADTAIAIVAKLTGTQVSNDEVRKALVKHAAE